VLDEDTLPGALVGIDSLYYDVRFLSGIYCYLRIIQIEKGGFKKITTHEDWIFSELCQGQVVVAVFCRFEARGKLTDKRKETIEKWGSVIYDRGCCISDIAEIERKLKKTIVVQNIGGGYFYNSGKYSSKGQPILVAAPEVS